MESFDATLDPRFMESRFPDGGGVRDVLGTDEAPCSGSTAGPLERSFLPLSLVDESIAFNTIVSEKYDGGMM